MKRTVLLLGCLLSMGLYAQTSPNGVYSTTEPRPTVLENLPREKSWVVQ